MADINTAEVKTFEGADPTAGERSERLDSTSARIGALVLDGLSSAKKVGEIVGGFFYFLSPVPKEFNFRTFKTHPDPIIKLRRDY